MIENLYKERTANFPRIKTDVLFADYNNETAYKGFVDEAIRFVEDFQLLDKSLWKRFVAQFDVEADADYDDGWRGEYWGKMMRGACFTYSYTKNPKLYSILTETVEDILSKEEKSGRISSYAVNHEFRGWDMWSRKYILLGLQYFLEICEDDELSERIVKSMRNQADYILSKVGSGEGKIEITDTTDFWRGLNSCSILEPFVRLYTITEEKSYLEFASYIVEKGGCDVENLFNLAYEDNLYPYQYPVVKAYEMISCFEGLIEYYRITGEEKHKQSVVNFADKLLESELTIIGSSGCTEEWFDHSYVRQANTTNGKVMQETCVTVTLMKFFYQLTLLTGDPKYADAFEISLYNAYLGSINTEKTISPEEKTEVLEIYGVDDTIIEPIPFGSYSPLVSGIRGNGTGGLKVMRDKHRYGCCACIGSAGTGIISKMALLSKNDGFAFNLYIDGNVKTYSPENNPVVFETVTEYPKNGDIKIVAALEKDEEFEISLRIPEWSKNTSIFVNGEKQNVTKGYTNIKRLWKNGDTISLEFDMRTKVIKPEPYGEQVLMTKIIWEHNFSIPLYDREDPLAKNHIALMRGPIVLAQDSRFGYSTQTPANIKVSDEGYADAVLSHSNEFKTIETLDVLLENGGYMKMCDYASAGKTWVEDSKMAAWIRNK